MNSGRVCELLKSANRWRNDYLLRKWIWGIWFWRWFSVTLTHDLNSNNSSHLFLGLVRQGGAPAKLTTNILLVNCLLTRVWAIILQYVEAEHGDDTLCQGNLGIQSVKIPVVPMFYYSSAGDCAYRLQAGPMHSSGWFCGWSDRLQVFYGRSVLL